MTEQSERPDWWQKNQRLREAFDLPEYVPPRFNDGTYKHEIVDRLEREHDCTITFVAKNPQHPCDWEISVDGERVATTGRRRTDSGNTIFTISTDEFVERVDAGLD